MLRMACPNVHDITEEETLFNSVPCKWKKKISITVKEWFSIPSKGLCSEKYM